MAFKRNPETHQLVITKNNQIAANYNQDGLNIDFIAELNIAGDNQVTIDYYFDPEVEMTSEQKAIVADHFRDDISKRFQQLDDEVLEDD